MPSQPLSDWLGDTESMLREAGIETARLDALVLLSDELDQDKSWILAHPEYDIQGSVVEKLNKKVAQRTQHTPLAYIRGKVEFYGREFTVNEHVLVPRPESEAMITLLKQLPAPKNQCLLIDVGTGSGCLAITAKLELPKAEVVALDIDVDCLKLAKQNAAALQATIAFFESNLLSALQAPNTKQQTSVILANLPYVPENYSINAAAKHEPRLALYGGTDGLDLYRKLFTQVQALAAPPAWIITEALRHQHSSLAGIARENGYKLHASDDLAQLFQFSG
ncbi:protein-(glutamine-N5) methyltransferase, release factor-specific [Candidatus Saccharibacteria bacterium]|nr:MAG: protein-(glutamine-N5) methyltransferase, release factor-specific [Candidatus Saccharibacteria bacterium]